MGVQGDDVPRRDTGLEHTYRLVLEHETVVCRGRGQRVVGAQVHASMMARGRSVVHPHENRVPEAGHVMYHGRTKRSPSIVSKPSVRLSVLLLAAIGLPLAAPAQSGKAPFAYRMQVLSPAAGYLSSAAFALNDRGDVVGECMQNGGAPSVAAKWHLDQPDILGLVPRGHSSVATAINDTGFAVGSGDDGDDRPRACVFDGGTARIIDNGANNAHTVFVTATGEIVGNFAQGFGTTWLPTVWHEDPQHPGRYDEEFLPRFTDPNGFESYNYINDANDALVCVGQVSSTLWSARGGYWSSDAGHPLTLLEPLPGQWDSYAMGVNGQGVIVGLSDVGTFSTTPVVWTPAPGFHAKALPLFPGELHGAASKISDNGDIVGWHGPASRPALWRNGRIYDLASLVDSTVAGWTLDVVTDINARGEIVGYGHQGTTFRAFVLRPYARAARPAAR